MHSSYRQQQADPFQRPSSQSSHHSSHYQPYRPPSSQQPHPASSQSSIYESGSEGAQSQHALSLASSGAPPTIGNLSLPSPLFGASIFNLVLSDSHTSPETGSVPPLPVNALGQSQAGVVGGRRGSLARPGHAGREPTLYFSGPRMAGDERVRKEGRVEEDMLVLPYPDVGEEAEIGPGEPNKWTQTEWQSVKQFLRKRGYEVDLTGGIHLPLPVSRRSDRLLLHLHLVPADDGASDELDVIERLGSLSLRTQARVHGSQAIVPVVSLVPLSEHWTAVVSERYEILSESTKLSPGAFATLAKEVTAAVAFLHSHHICHLGLTPAAVAFSNTTPARYSLTDFTSSVQLDPLAKKVPLVSGQAVGKAYAAPEIATSETGRYNPILGDKYSLGRTLEKLAQNARVESTGLQAVVAKLTAPAGERTVTVAEALADLRQAFP